RRVPPRWKALAELKAGTIVGCEFCIDLHSSLARAAGVDAEQLLALPRHRDSALFSEVESLVLDYATAMTRSPQQVTDELHRALRAHFDERQILELTAAIAVENLRARFAAALDATPAGFSEGLVCAVPERQR